MSRRILALVGAVLAIALVVGLWLYRGRSGGTRAVIDAGAPAAAARGGDRPALAPVARPGAGDVEVAGRVLDVAGGAVALVSVTAELELGPGVASMPGLALTPAVVAVTDQDGRFTLIGLVAGRYRLRVEGAGIVTAEVRFVDVPSSAIDLVVAREVELLGAVIDDGAPAAEVEVSLAAADGVRRTRSNRSGLFRFEELPEGVYQVWAGRGDRAAPAQRIERLGAGPFEAVTLVLGPAAIVRGRVVDAGDGAGLAASVRLTAAEGGEPARFAAADDDGNFTIEAVPFGRWTADAFAVGYVVEESIQFEVGGSFVPELRLGRGAMLEGRVLTALGAPVEGAAVSVESGGVVVASAATVAESRARFLGQRTTVVDGQRFLPRGELGVLLGPIPFPPPAGAASVRVATIVGDPDPAATPIAAVAPELEPRFLTDGDGRFRVPGLAAGRVRVIASHADYADGRGDEVAVVAGQVRRGLELVLHPGVVVTGTVTDTAGAVVVGATVVAAIDGADGRRLQGVTGTDGVYVLGPIATDAVLHASATGHGQTSRPLVLELSATRSERREDFVLDRADAVLAGRVTDASGFPARGARVSVRRPGSGDVLRTAVTDDTGRYQIDGLPAGGLELRVEHAGFPVTVEAVDTARVANVELVYGGGIAAEVRDAHTRGAIAGARVVATGPGAVEVRALTGEEGEVELAPLAAGAWTLALSATGYVAVRRAVDVSAGDRPAAITVRDLRLELARGATLAGVVRDGNGDRVRGARVKVGEVSALTDEHGRFRLRDVATGEVALTADKGPLRGGERLSLSPGDERVTLEITLR